MSRYISNIRYQMKKIIFEIKHEVQKKGFTILQENNGANKQNYSYKMDTYLKRIFLSFLKYNQRMRMTIGREGDKDAVLKATKRYLQFKSLIFQQLNKQLYAITFLSKEWRKTTESTWIIDPDLIICRAGLFVQLQIFDNRIWNLIFLIVAKSYPRFNLDQEEKILVILIKYIHLFDQSYIKSHYSEMRRIKDILDVDYFLLCIDLGRNHNEIAQKPELMKQSYLILRLKIQLLLKIQQNEHIGTSYLSKQVRKHFVWLHKYAYQLEAQEVIDLVYNLCLLRIVDQDMIKAMHECLYMADQLENKLTLNSVLKLLKIWNQYHKPNQKVYLQLIHPFLLLKLQQGFQKQFQKVENNQEVGNIKPSYEYELLDGDAKLSFAQNFEIWCEIALNIVLCNLENHDFPEMLIDKVELINHYLQPTQKIQNEHLNSTKFILSLKLRTKNINFTDQFFEGLKQFHRLAELPPNIFENPVRKMWRNIVKDVVMQDDFFQDVKMQGFFNVDFFIKYNDHYFVIEIVGTHSGAQQFQKSTITGIGINKLKEELLKQMGIIIIKIKPNDRIPKLIARLNLFDYGRQYVSTLLDKAIKINESEECK